MPPDAPNCNRDLLLAYTLPYLAYGGIGLLAGPALGPQGTYAARLLIVGALLAWGWRRYQPLRGPGSPAVSIAVGALAGVLGLALWIALLRPFADPAAPAWETGDWAWRLAGSTLLPPLIEELLLRGWVLGVGVEFDRARRAGAAAPLAVALDGRSVQRLEPGAWTPLAVALSTVIFALGHEVAAWPAAVAYGLLMCGLWIARRDLLSCMAAHAVTNALLALWVRQTGEWGLW